ncbi:MAG TPA: acetyl-coenzyme A synthetase N-terminal domain-containing protein, partial [Cytophagaceae bacterium]|nr:acetyl-coenzyme A synthetase N-terminal domain-containing protein [Cytophagaceae bacterium]
MSNRIRTFEEYKKEYQYSVEKPEEFWAEKASYFTWKKKWDKVLDWNFEKGESKWFIGGKLNITENCLDRHLSTRGDQVAAIWEPNDV